MNILSRTSKSARRSFHLCFSITRNFRQWSVGCRLISNFKKLFILLLLLLLLLLLVSVKKTFNQGVNPLARVENFRVGCKSFSEGVKISVRSLGLRPARYRQLFEVFEFLLQFLIDFESWKDFDGRIDAPPSPSWNWDFKNWKKRRRRLLEIRRIETLFDAEKIDLD